MYIVKEPVVCKFFRLVIIGACIMALSSCNSFRKAVRDDLSYPVAKGARLQLISNQFGFTEGPASDKAGNVFFTDQPNNKIWKYDVEGSLSVFMEQPGRANGMYFNSSGDLIACADENNQLWSISPNGQVQILADSYNKQLMNGPNDVWVSKNGTIYFTDPYYKRSYWKRTQPPLNVQGLYILRKGAEQPERLEEGLKKPNGIVGTPDGRFLYVADIEDNKTYRYSVNADGSLSSRKLFAPQGSDGMTIDNKGNVYLSGNGVTIYNPEGVKIKQIPVPAKWTANVCFGGSNKDWLFITASENLFKLKMQVRGAF